MKVYSSFILVVTLGLSLSCVQSVPVRTVPKEHAAVRASHAKGQTAAHGSGSANTAPKKKVDIHPAVVLVIKERVANAKSLIGNITTQSLDKGLGNMPQFAKLFTAPDIALFRQYDLADPVSQYGNWCGGGHGGYQDCCKGTQCSECDWKDDSVTEECLKQCPPIDALDLQCAFHDRCTLNNPSPAEDCLSFQGVVGNFCPCDCVLVRRWKQTECSTNTCNIFKHIAIEYFEHGDVCWQMGGKNHTCNRYGPSLDKYCPDSIAAIAPQGPCINEPCGAHAYCTRNPQAPRPECGCLGGYEQDPATGSCAPRVQVENERAKALEQGNKGGQ